MKKLILPFAGLCLLACRTAAQTCSVNAGVPARVCEQADSFLLSGNATGALATTAAWRLVTGPNIPVITDSSASSTSVTGFVAGTYVFRYGATCSDSSVVADSVTISVDPIPVFTAGTDTSICGLSMDMRATLPPGATGIWSPVTNVSIATPSSPTSTFTVTGYTAACPKAYNAIWTVTQGACSASDTVNVSYGVENTSLPVIADQVICGTSFLSNVNYYYGCGGTMNVTQLSGPVSATVLYPFGAPSTLSYTPFTINGMTSGNYLFAVEVQRCSGTTYRDTFQLSVGTSEPLTDPGYTSKFLCSEQFDSVYYFEPASSLLPGETLTWNLTPAYKIPALPDPIVDTSGGVLRISNTIHPDSGTANSFYDYAYRYTISNGTCSTTNGIILRFYTPLPERAFQSVFNLPCGVTAANIAIPESGSAASYTFQGLKIISKPAGAPDPVYRYSTAGRQDVSGLQPGRYLFSFEYYWGGERRCGTKPVAVEVNVSQAPGLSNAGTDQVLPCGVDSSVLAGNIPPPGQRGTWRLVSGPSTVILTNPNAASLIIKNLQPGVYRFRWEIAYGITCPAQYDEMQVIVTPSAPVTNAGPDRTVCYGYAVPLNGTGFGPGTEGRWRQTGGPAVVIADSTASATSISGTLASSVYTFSYTLSNACGSSSDTVVVTTTASQGPSDARITTADTCISVSSVTLNALAATSGSGMWSQLSGPTTATIASPASNNTAVSGLSGGVYRFLWRISKAGCDTVTDTVAVAYRSGTLIASAGADRFVCQDSIHLDADSPSLGTGVWSQLTGAAAVLADSSAPRTAVNDLLPGEYRFRWTVRLGACPSDSDEVQVVVSRPSSVAKAMNDTTICGLALPIYGQMNLPIQADTPAFGAGTWGIIEGPYSFSTTSGIADPGAPNTTIAIRGGYYKLLWKVSNGDCPAFYDTVHIDFVPQADAGLGSANICEKNSYSLQGTEGGSGTVQWSQLSGPAATITRPDNEFTVLTDLVTGTYRFRYAVLHPATGCSSSDTITITNSERVPADAGRDTVFCWMPGGTVLYLQADTPSAGTGTWFRNSGTGSLTYSPGSNSNPTYATVSDAGLHQFRWAVVNGGCQTIDYKDVLAERISVPPVNFTALSSCNDSFSVQVSSPYSNFDYAWSFQRARIRDTAGRNLTGPITNNFRVRDTNMIFLTLTNPATGCSAKDSTEIIVNCAYLPLPLTLLSFRAYKRATTVLLQWSVAAEKDIRNYEVQRSTNGVAWQTIGEEAAKNNNIRVQYDFTDEEPARGRNLYRLKINEYYQSSSYSPVRVVEMDASGPQLLIYPNPADQEIRVLLTDTDNAGYQLSDITGRKLVQGELMGGTDNSIDIRNIPAGIYVLKIMSGDLILSDHKVQVCR